MRRVVPALSEPAGALLALLGALYEDGVGSVYTRRGLIGYRSVLESPYVYIPHDVVVPGVLTLGDVCDLAGALAPRSLRMEGLVDGLGRSVSADAARTIYRPALEIYREVEAGERIEISREATSPARWLLSR